MAKTIKCNVNFDLTAVIQSSGLKTLQEAREASREAIAGGEHGDGEHKAMIEIFASDRTEEDLLKLILRKSIREMIREELEGELNTADTSVRVGNIKVDFKAREV